MPRAQQTKGEQSVRINAHLSYASSASSSAATATLIPGANCRMLITVTVHSLTSTACPATKAHREPRVMSLMKGRFVASANRRVDFLLSMEYAEDLLVKGKGERSGEWDRRWVCTSTGCNVSHLKV